MGMCTVCIFLFLSFLFFFNYQTNWALDERTWCPFVHHCRLLFTYLTVLGTRLECFSNRERSFISFVKQTLRYVFEEMFHVALKMPCCCLNFGLRKSTGSFLEQRLVVWAEQAFRGVQARFLNRERKNVVHVIQRRKQFFFQKVFSIFFPMPGNDRRSRQRRRWRNQWSRIPSYHEKDEFVLKHCLSFTIYVYYCGLDHYE